MTTISDEEKALVEEHRERKRVAALPPYWDCSKCGFSNKPHAYRQDNTKCEQCGKVRSGADRES